LRFILSLLLSVAFGALSAVEQLFVYVSQRVL